MLMRIIEVGELPCMRVISPWADGDTVSRHGSLWPMPDDTALLGPSFDDAADDIAELAASTASVLCDWWRRAERVLEHYDWEAQNLRFGRIDLAASTGGPQLWRSSTQRR
jgi:hypothetical protein